MEEGKSHLSFLVERQRHAHDRRTGDGINITWLKVLETVKHETQQTKNARRLNAVAARAKLAKLQVKCRLSRAICAGKSQVEPTTKARV